MTTGGSEVIRAVPPMHQASHGEMVPIRFEKRWFQGISAIKLGVAIFLLFPFIFILSILVSEEIDQFFMVFILLVFLPLIAPIIVYIILLLLRTRPAAFEMDARGVRIYRNGRLVKDIQFGPDVVVGVVFVGYWDDISPGLSLRAMGVDENELSFFDRRGFGPLFGYRFRSGGKKIVVTRKHGWDVRWIQWMWQPLMVEMDRYGMQKDRSMDKYLRKRREMGLPFP